MAECVAERVAESARTLLRRSRNLREGLGKIYYVARFVRRRSVGYTTRALSSVAQDRSTYTR